MEGKKEAKKPEGLGFKLGLHNFLAFFIFFAIKRGEKQILFLDLNSMIYVCKDPIF